MQNGRQEFKKQIVKHYIKPAINSNRNQDCILHLLKSPNVEEILIVQKNISILKSNQTQTLTNTHTEIQLDTENVKLCEENKNVLTISQSVENKDDFEEDFKFKVPGKVKKQRKNENKSQVKTPIIYQSIFDNNLLRANGGKLGCECSALTSLTYGNPFFKNLSKNPIYKKFTVKCAVVDINMISKGHLITFCPIEEFHHIINTMKPTLYVKEYVTGTHDAIDITYSLIIRLAKNNICVKEYVVKHTFTQAEKKLLEIRICDYQDFDAIYYYHMVCIKPEGGVKLSLKKVMSIKIGKSVLMFLSKTIQWTNSDGPKVIVEKVNQPSDILFY